MSGAFYRLQAPAEWLTSVERLSFSSLTSLERCPRQWQMVRSKWPGFERFPTRENPRAVTGTIVHTALEALFKALALRGLPPKGSPAFREVVREINVPGRVAAAIDDYHARFDKHPRRLSFQLPSDAEALFNEVSRLFQTTYASVAPTTAVVLPADRTRTPTRDVDPCTRLERLGVLTEFPVEHPTLPFRGVIDLLRRDAGGTHVVDFKTGDPKPEHHEQLTLYALMWWRMTGQAPSSLEIRHPKGTTRFPVDEARMTLTEQRLSERIRAVQQALVQTPAPARVGEHCQHCDARPFCDAYWTQGTPALVASKPDGLHWIDAEVTVPAEVMDHGFEGLVRGGRKLPVVYDEENGAVHGPFIAGERLRILRGMAADAANEVRLQRTSEVFHTEPLSDASEVAPRRSL